MESNQSCCTHKVNVMGLSKPLKIRVVVTSGHHEGTSGIRVSFLIIMILLTLQLVANTFHL